MSNPPPVPLQRLRFEEAAEAYLRHLRTEHPEHFMESIAQARQRQISVVSVELISVERPDTHMYSELLVQWLRKGGEIAQVVPDNMVVISPDTPKATGSYNI